LAAQSGLHEFEDSQITRALALYDAASQVWVLEPATMPSRPTGAGRLVTTAAGGLGGMGLGILLVCLAEFFNTTIRRKEEIEQLVGIPVIGVVPKMKEVVGNQDMVSS